MHAGALVAQWIEQFRPKEEMGVRFPPRAPRRKSQRFRCRLASLGDQIVRIFRGKKKFPIPLEAEKKNFNHWI